MVLDGVFLSPVGLLALLAVVPVLLLYLVRPDPRELDLPTTRFLRDDRGEDASSPVLERLSRNLLLVVQVAAIVLLAASLATPYTLVSEASTVEETVVVVDGSASMALVLAAKARAFLRGRTHVSWEDVEAMAPPVLRHRILLDFRAEREGTTPDDAIASLSAGG